MKAAHLAGETPALPGGSDCVVQAAAPITLQVERYMRVADLFQGFDHFDRITVGQKL